MGGNETCFDTNLMNCVTDVLNEYRNKVQGEILKSLDPLQRRALSPAQNSRNVHPDSPHSADDKVLTTPLRIPQSIYETFKSNERPLVFPSPRPEKLGKSSTLHDASLNAKPLRRDTLVLMVQNYSSVIFADEPQTFLLIIANKSLPYGSFIGLLGSTALRLTCTGKTLTATVPPQKPGEAFFTLKFGSTVDSKPSSHTPLIQFRMTHVDILGHMPLNALPVTIVRPPKPVAQPCPSYTLLTKSSTAKTQVKTHGSHTKKPLVNALLNSIHSKDKICCKRKNQINSRRLPSTHHIKTKASDSQRSIWKRLNNLVSNEWESTQQPEIRTIKELQLALASLDTSLINASVPLMVRASIFYSIPEVNRKFIRLYHSSLFEVQPFKIYSAHIFTKGKSTETYSIFAFSLRKQLSDETHQENTQPGIRHKYPPTPDSPFIASLERFEAKDRMCSDPRYWKLIDEAVPCKNLAASKLNTQSLDLRISPCLPPLFYKRVTRMHPEKIDNGIQLAEGVFIHWERWPQNILRDNYTFVENKKQQDMLQADFRKQTIKFSPNKTSFSDNQPPISHNPKHSDQDNAMHNKIASKNTIQSASMEKTPHLKKNILSVNQSSDKQSSNSTEKILIEFEKKNPDGDKPKEQQEQQQQSVDKNEEQLSLNLDEEGSIESIPDQIMVQEFKHTSTMTFGVTLCVGDYLYTSVQGVSARLVEFILREWMSHVPLKRAALFPKHTSHPGYNSSYPSLSKCGL